ncbi:unnamed protein product [Prunus brigantina]
MIMISYFELGQLLNLCVGYIEVYGPYPTHVVKINISPPCGAFWLDEDHDIWDAKSNRDQFSSSGLFQLEFPLQELAHDC